MMNSHDNTNHTEASEQTPDRFNPLWDVRCSGSSSHPRLGELPTLSHLRTWKYSFGTSTNHNQRPIRATMLILHIKVFMMDIGNNSSISNFATFTVLCFFKQPTISFSRSDNETILPRSGCLWPPGWVGTSSLHRTKTEELSTGPTDAAAFGESSLGTHSIFALRSLDHHVIDLVCADANARQPLAIREMGSSVRPGVQLDAWNESPDCIVER